MLHDFKKITTECISDNGVKKESSDLEKTSNILKGLRKGLNYVINNSPATVANKLRNSTPNQVMQSLFGPRRAPKITRTTVSGSYGSKGTAAVNPSRTVAGGGFGRKGSPTANPSQATMGGGSAQNTSQQTMGNPTANPSQATMGGGSAQNTSQQTMGNQNPNNPSQAAQTGQAQGPSSGVSGWIADNPLLALGGAGLAGAATGYMLAPSPEQRPYIPPYYYPGRF